MVAKGDYSNLIQIAKWVDEAKLTPIIDSTYAFEDYRKGCNRTLESGKKGSIIMKIEGH